MIDRLIRIYTPFICAVIAIIHGVLYLCECTGTIYWILGNFTGHSILVIGYIIATSKRMCIWYKMTTYMLMYVNVINILYRTNCIKRFEDIICLSIIINFSALIMFLIYRIKVGITKFLC